MTDHKIGTREEWLAERLELLKAEKALTRRSDELAQWRQRLPWVRIDKEYRFETDEGIGVSCRSLQRTLAAPRLSLHVRPRVHSGCPACSAIADGFNGFAVHLEHHDVAMIAVSRAPIASVAGLQAPHGLDVHVGIIAGQRFQLRLQHVLHRRTAAFRQHRLQLPARSARPQVRRPAQRAVKTSDRAGLDSGEFRGHDRHRPPHLHPRGAGHERVRALRRRRLPHLLRLRARPRRSLGNVPVARPCAEGAQRDRAVVSADTTSTHENLDSGGHAKRVIWMLRSASVSALVASMNPFPRCAFVIKPLLNKRSINYQSNPQRLNTPTFPHF